MLFKYRNVNQFVSIFNQIDLFIKRVILYAL